MKRCLLAAAVALALSACDTEPRTEIIVVTDTDLAVPAEIDRLRIDVIPPTGAPQSVDTPLADRSLLPAWLGLVHTGGPLGLFEVHVTGLRGDELVVQRSARVSFIPEQTLVLRMFLLRDCVGVSCASEETCGEDGCRPETILPGELEVWDGTVPSLEPRDAGPPGDGGMDAGEPDAGADAGEPDPDAGDPDAGEPDPDAGDPDAGEPDPDAGDPDAGEPDPDAGRPDAGGSDAGDPCADCPWGCVADACIDPDIPNLADDDHAWLEAGGRELVLSEDAVIETSGPNAGRIRAGTTNLRRGGEGVVDGIELAVRTQPGGAPDLAVLVMRSFQIQRDVTVEVRGDRALVIVTSEDIRIFGTLDARARGAEPGPGGSGPEGGLGAGLPGSRPGADRSDDPGGGGGSFGGTGGAGGDSNDGAGGAGGPPYGAGLAPLRGGSGGGHGLDLDGDGLGGGGGGAIQLVSNSLIRVGLFGVIDAGGGGGSGDPQNGGGGGGSGGGVLLAAPVVEGPGLCAANGGGGGGVEDGTDGVAKIGRAGGGAGTGDEAPGGAGSGSAASAVDGRDGSPGSGSGGGGGGGAGRIRIVNATGATPDELRLSGAVQVDAVTPR